MRPRKRREEMTAKRVIPRWAKRRDHASIVLQQPAHDPQYLCRIVEMLESIERQDHVCFFIRVRRERTSISDTTLSSRFPRIRKSALANVDPDDFPGATRRH